MSVENASAIWVGAVGVGLYVRKLGVGATPSARANVLVGCVMFQKIVWSIFLDGLSYLNLRLTYLPSSYIICYSSFAYKNVLSLFYISSPIIFIGFVADVLENAW